MEEEQDFRLCQVCLKAIATQEHHLSYDPVIKIHVCKTCHRSIHGGASMGSDKVDALTKKLVGRPIMSASERKGTGYSFQFPSHEFIYSLDMIAKREGITRKTLILRFCEEGIAKHGPGNPQTILNSYSEGGELTIHQFVGRARQFFLNRGMASKKEVLQYLIDSDVPGLERATITKGILSWLKERGIEVLE